jgi:predicted transcriptional regulator
MSEADSKEEQAMTVRLPKGDHRKLGHLAVETGVSMNTMIKQAVAQWLARQEKKS